LGELLTSAGVGALIGALWLARRQRAHGLDRVVAWATCGFGASLILFAVSKTHWLSLLFLVPAGFSLMVELGATNTLVQSIVSNTMRGRVMGIYTMMFLGMAPFGSLIAGYIAQHFGAPNAVLFCGVASIASAVVFFRHLRDLRIDDHISQARADARM